jgi:hypothetical protein
LEDAMKKVDLAFPEFLFIVATRAALGAGAALLATRRCSRQGRQRLGAALFGIGVATTVPALIFVFGRDRAPVPPAAEERENPTAT